MTPNDSQADIKTLLQFANQWWQDNVPPQSVAEAEQLVQAMSQQVAATMMSAALKQNSGRHSYQGVRLPCPCGGQAEFVSYRRRNLRTLCGEHRVQRAYYRCRQCGQGQLPWDAAQGLNRRLWTPAVKALAADCCGRLTYGETSQLLERLLNLPLEESSLEAVVAEVGDRLRAAEAEQITAVFDHLEQPKLAPEVAGQPPERLYIGIDAAKAHTGGSWHDVKCGVIYAAQPTAGQADQPQQQHYLACQEEAAAFGRRLYATALGRGLAAAPQSVVIGDGAVWIWNLASEHFGDAIEILDYYHACEHLWTVAHSCYGEGSPAARRWAKRRSKRLLEQGAGPLIESLCQRQAATPEQQQLLARELAYFQRNRHRMRYPLFRKQGLMIGSGPVEAACKVVVGQRLKGAGMRWTEPGADAMLAVRTAVLNDRPGQLAQHAWAA